VQNEKDVAPLGVKGVGRRTRNRGKAKSDPGGGGCPKGSNGKETQPGIKTGFEEKAIVSCNS